VVSFLLLKSLIRCKKHAYSTSAAGTLKKFLDISSRIVVIPCFSARFFARCIVLELLSLYLAALNKYRAIFIASSSR